MKNYIDSVFSHELKNSLTSIKFALEMFAKYEMNYDEKKNFVTSTLTSILSTIEIVDEYLEFVKFKFQSSLTTEKVELSELLNELKTDLESYAKEKYVSIYIQKNSYTLKINKFWLKRAIYNIVSNAIKYNKENGTINLNIEPTYNGVYIFISDTGKGIEQKKIKTIFKTFEQINDNSEGFGIGLALSKAVVDSFGGFIKVHSNEAIGSDFILFLPKEPKSVTIKKILTAITSLSLILFLSVSSFPIYQQEYTKTFQAGYDTFLFEDGTRIRFEHNAQYTLEAKKNLFNSTYKLNARLKSGTALFKMDKNKIALLMGKKEFNNLGTNFFASQGHSSAVAVFQGSVKSENLVLDKGEGVSIQDRNIEKMALPQGVKDIDISSGYLSYRAASQLNKFQIVISTDQNFSNITHNFYTTKKRVPLYFENDSLYYVKVFAFNKQNLPSQPVTTGHINLRHYKKALGYLQENNVQEATLELRSSISTIKHNSPLPYYEIAKLYYKNKDYDKSIKHIQIAIQIQDKVEYNTLLLKNLEKQNKILEAKSIIDKMFLNYPNNTNILYYKSLSLHLSGKDKLASTYLYKVLQRDPYYENANSLMSKILEKMGQSSLSQYYKKLGR